MHHHEGSCACGGKHHEHSHTHAHGESCGCGCECAAVNVPESLSSIQADFLLALRQRHCLPAACFSMTKADDTGRYMVALAPVYLSSRLDSMEQIKGIGKELSGLEAMGLITLDYDMPLRDYPYEEYKSSSLYAYFAETVAEAAKHPSPAFDMPMLELGSMALTGAGEAAADKLLT